MPEDVYIHAGFGFWAAVLLHWAGVPPLGVVALVSIGIYGREWWKHWHLLPGQEPDWADTRRDVAGGVVGLALGLLVSLVL